MDKKRRSEKTLCAAVPRCLERAGTLKPPCKVGCRPRPPVALLRSIPAFRNLNVEVAALPAVLFPPEQGKRYRAGLLGPGRNIGMMHPVAQRRTRRRLVRRPVVRRPTHVERLLRVHPQ